MVRRVAALLLLVACSQAAWAEDAQQLYDKKCKVCHTLKGVSGPKAKVGGKLDGVGSKRDEAWLRAYLVDPKSKIPDSKMKPVKLPQAEFDALVAFLMSQK